MELQNTQYLCNLTKEELDSMINLAFLDFTKDKSASDKKCYYVYEQPSLKSHFKACSKYDDNTIFLSIQSLMKYHPLYTYLFASFPNKAEEVMQNDLVALLKALVIRLASLGYKIAVRDSFKSPDLTTEILLLLNYYGYDTSLIVFKNSFYNITLESIHQYAISLITGLNHVSLNPITISLETLLDYLKRGLIISGDIIDGLVNIKFAKDKKGKLDLMCTVNEYADYSEPAFYDKCEKLSSFIETHRRYLEKKAYEDLMARLKYLKSSYYNSIDISYLALDKGR